MIGIPGKYVQLFIQNQRVFWIGLGLFIGGLFIAANVHLFTVAFNSQPDCVDHLKTKGNMDGSFRAAKSSCRKTVTK
jgi:hypothetical protein